MLTAVIVFLIVVVLGLAIATVPVLVLCAQIYECIECLKCTRKLCICTHNGVTAVVRKRDYNRAYRRYWRSVRKGAIKPPKTGDAPILYIPNTVAFAHDNLDEMTRYALVLDDCQLERVSLYVPIKNHWGRSKGDRTFEWLYFVTHGRKYEKLAA